MLMFNKTLQLYCFSHENKRLMKLKNLAKGFTNKNYLKNNKH